MRLGEDPVTGYTVNDEVWERLTGKWAGHILDEIRKINEGGGLELLHLPQA
jgi:hypothetical protein